MMATMISLSGLDLSRVRNILAYDEATGVFTWKANRRRAKAGDKAGRVGSHGYIVIYVDGTYVLGHRLAWFMSYGCMPHGAIDHRNCVRTDNRLENLRLASPSQNKQNIRVRSDSGSGVKGVHWHKQSQKWNAYIRVDGRKRSLGLYHSISDARQAYVSAASQYFGEFARA